MRRRISRLFLCLDAWRASLEASLVYGVLLAALWTVHSEFTQRVVLQGLFFISLAGGGLCAVRLKLPPPSRRLRIEARIGLVLTLLLTFGAVGIDPITSSWPDQYPLVPVGQLILIVLTGGTYIGPRCAVYFLLFWNRIRRRRLLWSLTNAHIVVFLLFFALFIGRAVYSLVTSTRFFSLLAIEDSNLSLSEAAR